MILEITCWLLIGVVGAVLVWNTNKRYHPISRYAPIEWCPSPFAIACWAVVSVGGPVLLVFAIVLTVSTWLQNMPDDHWFVSPICKKEDETE